MVTTRRKAQGAGALINDWEEQAMKQTTKMSRAVSQLEHMYNAINEDFWGSELPPVIVTVQSRPGTYGHSSRAKVWQRKEDSLFEINVAAEVLSFPIEETIDTLLHEMVHIFCRVHDIKEVSNGTAYHNKKFKAIAESHGLNCIYTGSRYGWNTTPSDALVAYAIKKGWNEIQISRNAVQAIRIAAAGASQPGPVRIPGDKAPSSTRKLICPKCSQTVRATRTVNIITLIIILIAFAFAILFLAISRGSNSASSNNSAAETSPPSYTVKLDRQEGFRGSSSVYPHLGEAMPSAQAPSRSGYDFAGYYSSPNGKGTMYYDANMSSAHNWDKAETTTLYAYWVKKQEKKYSPTASEDDLVYVDIVSISPTYGIYGTGLNYSTVYSHFVCKCRSSSGDTVWIYISTEEYKELFDSSINSEIYAFSNNAKKITLSPSKRIHGTIVLANSIVDDLSSETADIIIKFTSLS